MISKLQERLTDLKDDADFLPKHLLNTALAYEWDRLSEDPPLDDAGAIRDSFKREEAARLYKAAVDAPDTEYTARDAQAAKMQSDLLSSLQAGFVMKHRSRLKLFADAASMRKSINDSRITLIHERQIANVESAT